MAFLTRTNLPSFLLAAAALFFFIAGVRALRLGSRTIYFRHRRQRVLAGWWMTGASLLLATVAVLIFRARTPAFVPEPVTPTLVITSTRLAVTPSRTFTPSPSPSPALTSTASATATPHLPLSLEIMVVSSVTPQAEVTIEDIRFSETLPGGFPVGNRFEWLNPLKRMYASFAYTHMNYGVQFTALWFRNGELVYYESSPWKSGGHGRSASEWEPAPHEWHPGVYEVQFFVGTEWKATGRFTLKGDPPTPTFTPTASTTWTPSPLPSETPSATPTK
jgi:hypothetical protein